MSKIRLILKPITSEQITIGNFFCARNTGIGLGHINGAKATQRKQIHISQNLDALAEFQYVTGKQPGKDHSYFWSFGHRDIRKASFLHPHSANRYDKIVIYTNFSLSYGNYVQMVKITNSEGSQSILLSMNKTTILTCFPSKYLPTLKNNEPNKKRRPRSPSPSTSPIVTHFVRDNKVITKTSRKCMVFKILTLAKKDIIEEVCHLGENPPTHCEGFSLTYEDLAAKTANHRQHRTKILGGVVTTYVKDCNFNAKFSSIFLTKDGAIYTCGWGADGQTGQGTYDNISTAGLVVGDVAGENIVKVSCRADCALALNDAGDVFGWGNSEYHQLNSVTSEMQIHSARRLQLPSHIGKVVDVAAAGTMCLILNESGDVFSWGYGPIGRGPEVSYCKEPTLIPRTLFGCNQLAPDVKVSSVHCGLNMLGAVNSQGSLYTWGKNTGGCLGHGHIKDHYFPIRVCIAGSIKKVSMAVDHMAVLVKEIL
ncbi:unnamed protein product, partial [Meganyctiphanes norvegica]